MCEAEAKDRYEDSDSEDGEEEERQQLMQRVAEVKDCHQDLKDFSEQLLQRLAPHMKAPTTNTVSDDESKFSRHDLEVLKLKHAALLREHAALKRQVLADCPKSSPRRDIPGVSASKRNQISQRCFAATSGETQVQLEQLEEVVQRSLDDVVLPAGISNDSGFSSGLGIGFPKRVVSLPQTPEPGPEKKVQQPIFRQTVSLTQAGMQVGGSSGSVADSRPSTISTTRKPFVMTRPGRQDPLPSFSNRLQSLRAKPLSPPSPLPSSPWPSSPSYQLQPPSPSMAGDGPRTPAKDPFGEGFDDFECLIGQRPFGMAADATSPSAWPRIQAVLSGFPAEAAGVMPDDVLVAVDGNRITSASWLVAAQAAPLPARFLFRRRLQQPGS